MYCNLALSFLLGLPLAVSGVSLPAAFEHNVIESRQTPSNSCVTTGVHVIASPGAGAGGAAGYSYIGSLVNNITSMIPGSNSAVIGPYPSGSFVVQTEGGEAQLRQYLSDYYAACPSSKIVLVGYSVGAVTMMNTLCGASPVPPWTTSSATVSSYPFIAAIAYGDETQAAGEPYNAGDCTNSAPNGHRTNVTACTDFFPHMQNYCYSGDAQCCAGGNVSNGHFVYPGMYDVTAATFVKNQYDAAVKKHHRHRKYHGY